MAKFYKGFHQDMTCLGFKFDEGKTYEEKEAKLCKSGFHACEMPLNVFDYYPPATSEYHEVELEELSDEHSDDTKRCGKRIKIGAKLSIRNLVEAQIEYINERAKPEEGGHATGYQGAASATGYQGAASATGRYGAASATGYQGAASATGDQGAASATGRYGAASATGYHGAASATGDQGAASATGDQGAASAIGYQGAASATGYQGIAIASGYMGRAMATKGNAICLCERGDWNGKCYPLLNVRAAIVDGVTIKENTWYILRNGEFVEVNA